MKLIGSLASPCVRKVRVVLAEKKLDCQFVLENMWAAETTINQLNPLTPVYKLLPPNGRERADIKCREALADGILDAAVTYSASA